MKTLSLFAMLLCVHIAISQTPKIDNLDLNFGGVIYDIIYDEINNDFIIAGDFTSIQGVPRQNLAIIDALSFTVKPINPISSINGAIKTLALVQTPSVFLPQTDGLSRLYLGGDFTSINGVGRNYLCQMRRVEPVFGPFNTNFFVSTSWDAQINNFSSDYTINDLFFYGDTLIAVGDFPINDIYNPWTTLTYNGIICFDPYADAVNATTTFDIFTSFSNANEIFQAEIVDDKLLVASDIGFQRYDTSDVLLNWYQACSGNYPHQFTLHETDQDALLLSRVRMSGFDGVGVHSLDGTSINCPTFSPQPEIFFNGLVQALGQNDVYEQYVYFAESDELLTYQRDGLTVIQPEQSIAINNNWYADFNSNNWRPRNLKVVQDKLFIFGDNLSLVNGQAHSGLAALCLPPHDAEEFTAIDTLVCEEELVVYSIPDSEFATGYKWTYSGSGAQYRIAGSGSPLQPLSTNFVDNSNANSLEVYYPIGSTSGALSVEPYSTCNSPTDYVLSSGQSLNVQVVALPDVSMSDTTYFNCYSDSSWMVVNSSSIGVSAFIYNGTDTTFNDSMLFEINNLPPQFPVQAYVGVVVEPINQCMSFDTSALLIDTVSIDLSGTFGSSPSFITCNAATATINCTTPNATIYWEYQNDPSIPLSNPFNIYSTDSLGFDLYVTQISNGCLSLDSMNVPTDTSTTAGNIVGYGGLTFPLDSISCNDPTLSLTCQAVDGTAEWLINGVPTGSDNMNLTEADTVGNTGNIGIFQYQTIKNGTGCEQIFEVAIAFDFETPYIVEHQGNPSINCSDTVAEVIHLSSGNPIEGWLDPFGVQTMNDTLLAFSMGEYYYQVQGSNGCLNTDTVIVSQTLDMSITMSVDTLICPDETVSILAVPTINTGETPTYLWSDGSTGNTANAIGGIDSELSVIVQTSSGCIGFDTTAILITAPISAYFSSSAGCSSGAIQVDSINGGSGNYEYSLDQINWQNTAAFTGVNVGIITVFVRDDLGCVYDFQETIDPAAIGLDVNFLVPTYNDLGDTLVAVSFESFLGFDSLNWVIPNGAVVAFQADSLIAFTMNTEGWYDLTLIGYSDTCQYSTTHQVYFGSSVQFDSIVNNLGVQSILVYPNPTSGDFTVEVELGEIQNYTIQVVSSSGQPLLGMSVSGIGKIISESFQFPQGTVSGSYIIHFICDYDIEQETIILN